MPRLKINPFYEPPSPPSALPQLQEVIQFHQGLQQYHPTPLWALDSLARELGLGSILVKDESARYGLKSFKALGAAYGMHRFIAQQAAENSRHRTWTFCTATDGNHGRAVAWAAREMGQRAVVFVPENVSRHRVQAIRREGAEVIIVPGTYEDAVRQAAQGSGAQGWQLISDVPDPTSTTITNWIMDGYMMLFWETFEQLRESGIPEPDVCFLQGGVGGLACAAVRFLENRLVFPNLVIVEPTDSDCLLESISSRGGRLSQARGSLNSIMGGLNCGRPSFLAWPVLRRRTRVFLAVEDDFARIAMGKLYRPVGDDPRIVAGESGAAGLAGLIAVDSQPELGPVRAGLGLKKDTTVLIVNTEGDTDPASFRKICGLEGPPNPSSLVH